MTQDPAPDPTLVTWHQHQVRRPRGVVLWFTGLSGSGKSTIANAVDQQLNELGCPSFVLDGDNVRLGLNPSYELLLPEYGEEFARRFGLGFGALDRQENIRRIGAVAELFCSAGLIATTAFISPFRIDRDRVRRQIEVAGGPGDFVEVFVDTPFEVCQSRDPKGLYRKALKGEIKNFTGIDSPYEPPLQPEISLRTTEATVGELAGVVIDYLRGIGKVRSTKGEG
ncbi:MAG: adenylyl-sulfate kinase [Planctomycetaceae bacterium]|nr:adenylyl-sulfate kinase [Planctomycetaceae bacterium]